MFTQPGFLTNEHFADRRARYVSPLRLYIITSVVFFFVLTAINFFGLNMHFGAATNSETTDSTQLVQSIEDVQALIKVRESDPELLKRIKQAAGSDLKQFIAKIIDKLPLINFLFVPLFALILNLLFISEKRFYVEHLVLVLHNSSFIFATFTIVYVFQPLLSHPVLNFALMLGAMTWMGIYSLKSLKNVYQQGWLATLNKGLLFGLIQLLLVGAGVLLSLYLTVTIS